MVNEYYFTNQDGEKSNNHNIFFEEYPRVRLGQEKYEKKTIPGRGNVYLHTGTYSDTEIEMLIDVNAVWSPKNRIDAYLEARTFLLGCKTISFCNEADYFYKVRYMELDDVEQYSEDAGDFDATAICEAGIYLKSGIQEYDPTDILVNPYSECRPEYRITGEGACILTVNGNRMKANVGQNLVIDTGRKLSYRNSGTMQNTAVSGDYTKLYLKPGTNTISITNGFTLKVVPNWRCM